MADLIIIVIIAAALAVGLRSTIKHFQGKSSCCGGGSYTPRKKKLHTVVEKKTLCISGMSCERCQNRVMEALNDIEGASATVSFKKGTAVVAMEHRIENDVLKAAVQKAGYMVTDIH